MSNKSSNLFTLVHSIVVAGILLSSVADEHVALNLYHQMREAQSLHQVGHFTASFFFMLSLFSKNGPLSASFSLFSSFQYN